MSSHSISGRPGWCSSLSVHVGKKSIISLIGNRYGLPRPDTSWACHWVCPFSLTTGTVFSPQRRFKCKCTCVSIFLLCVASRLLVLVLWLQHETRQQRVTGPVLAAVPALGCCCPLPPRPLCRAPAWLILAPGAPQGLSGPAEEAMGAVAGACAQRAAGSL